MLCTATQPVLSDLVQSFCPELQIRELCPQLSDAFQKFKRVRYRDGGTLSNEALAEELTRQNQVLCIVNTRKAAQELSALLPRREGFIYQP